MQQEEITDEYSKDNMQQEEITDEYSKDNRQQEEITDEYSKDNRQQEDYKSWYREGDSTELQFACTKKMLSMVTLHCPWNADIMTAEHLLQHC